MATVLDVIVDALRELNVLAAGETASADEAEHGLTALNRLVDQWAVERLSIYTVTRTVWTIPASTQDFTVGLGGTVSVARPVFIDHITFYDNANSPLNEIPLTPLTDDAWSAIRMKGTESPYPQSFWYNPTYPLATLSLWPKPTGANLRGVLYAPAAVAEFTSLAQDVALPPGYRRMIVKNLAMELAPSYERPPNPALIQQAQDSVAAVKRGNKRLMDMTTDMATWGGRGFDIYTD